MQIISSSTTDLPQISREILNRIEGVNCIIFDGEMGAGKTTLIKALCAEMGIVDQVNSPTFSLVNEYEKPSGEPVYHFDFYRLEDPVEALDFGVEEYFDSGHLCLLEWAERIEEYLPESGLIVRIGLKLSERTYTISTFGR